MRPVFFSKGIKVPKPTSLLFILVLCIAGYYLLQSLHETRYGLKRSSGYHTFLSSAAAGLILLLISTMIYSVAKLICVLLDINFSFGNVVLNYVLEFDAHYSSVALFDIGIMTLLLSALIPFCRYKSQEVQYAHFLAEFAEDSESPEYTKLFFSSYEYGLPILFTMSDRKVYIGYVPEIHAKPFNDVHVIPIFSGYRDKNNLKLVPVTPYEDIIKDVENDKEEELDLEAFSVSLPIREIVHAHLHDFNYYEKFKEREAKLSLDFEISYGGYYANDNVENN